MPRGGKRAGAGRPAQFTFSRKLALANEVTLLQSKNPAITIGEALKQLEGEGLILPQTRARYLTPKHFSEEILSLLTVPEREGILSALPRLSKEDPL
jgi:hypothetical protein